MLLRFRWLRRRVADAHGQRDGPGIGRPDAALGQWPRPADLGAQLGGSRGGLTGHVHRGQPGAAPVGSAVHRGFHAFDERSQRVEHRLVTALGAAEFDQRVMSGAQRLGHVDVSRMYRVTQPAPAAASAAPQSTPDVPPALAAQASPAATRTASVPPPRCAAEVAAARRRRGTTDHAATVIAVAGHGVDAAEFGFRVGHPRGDRRTRRRHALRSTRGGFVASHVVRPRLRRGRRGAAASRNVLRRGDLALAVCGGVGRGRPQPFQFLVEPRDGQRAAGHVEAGDQLADLGLHHRLSRLARAGPRRSSTPRRALRTWCGPAR